MRKSNQFIILLIVALMVTPIQAAGSISSIQMHANGPRVQTQIPTSSRSLNCNPPGQGPWDVVLATRCVNEKLKVNGNITIYNKLELIDTTLTFDNDYVDGFDLRATSGSELRIKGSIMNSSLSNRHFALLVDTNVVFSMNHSIIDGAGWKDLERFAGASSGPELTEYNKYFWLYAPGTTNLALTGDDGIEIRSTPLSFHNNTFLNFTHVRFFSDNNVVKDNTFDGIKHEGVAFMQDTKGHIVHDNVFKNATRINREIHAIRFYTNCQNVQLYNNQIEWMPFGITIANIPPWTGGYNFDIHHNTYYKVVVAFNGNFRKSRLHHETMDHIMRGISLDSTSDLLVDHNRITNITFQMDLENVLDQSYYNAVNGRGLLPNMAYWMWGFYCSKFMLNIGWWGRNITIEDNLFANAPPYTIALNTDQARGMYDIKIIDNTFENIGTHIPVGYKIRTDWTGHNSITNQTPITGASIMLEGSDDVHITGNVFMNVLNAITTSAPDALGNFGSLEISHNLMRGSGTFTWFEERYSGGWWSGNHETTKNGIGVATSIHYISGTGPDWDPWHLTIYKSNCIQTIDNNTFYDFGFPIVIDFRRDQSRAGEMGNKTAIVTDNIILKYIDAQTLTQYPNQIRWNDNVEEKKYPLVFPNVTQIDPHHREASGRYYVVPGGMEIPRYNDSALYAWDRLLWNPVGQSGDMGMAFSTNDGLNWYPVPSNGSLSDAPIDTGALALQIDLSTTYRLTHALVYDINLTYVHNDPPVLSPLKDMTSPKNRVVELMVQASDPDDDDLTYVWTQVLGPGVTLINNTTATASFSPDRSGVYGFSVEVDDGFSNVSDTIEISVNNNGPTIELDAPTRAFKQDLIKIHANAVDEDDDQLTYEWVQIGGPMIVSLLNNTSADPSFIPFQIGIYQFSVVVSDNEISAEPVDFTIEVVGRPPVAVLDLDTIEPFDGQNVTISGNGSYDTDGHIVSFFFDFGDGTETGWTNVSWWKHRYSQSGVINISLIVEDEDGNLSQLVHRAVTVVKRPHPPTADFTIDPIKGIVGREFTFTSRSVDTDGTIVSWAWDFGDGWNDTGPLVQHSYGSFGVYNIVLNVTDNDGLSASISKQLDVSSIPNAPPTIKDFAPKGVVTSRVGGSANFKITVEDPDGDEITYQWFVDGELVSGGKGNTLDVEFHRIGQHNVTVKATDGRSDPVVQEWSIKVIKKEKDMEPMPYMWAIIISAIAIGVVAFLMFFFLTRGKGKDPPSDPITSADAAPLPQAPPPPQSRD